MAIICSTTYNSSLFTYHEGTFVAEASDLPEPESRVYNDSTDTGFWIRSKKTDQRVLFVLEKTMIDGEREVIGWEYRPDRILHADLHRAGIRAIVYND